MAHYRLYLMNELGHIADATDLDCEDDARAVAAVEELSDHRPKEVWQGDRLVAVVLRPAKSAPEGPSASAA